MSHNRCTIIREINLILFMIYFYYIFKKGVKHGVVMACHFQKWGRKSEKADGNIHHNYSFSWTSRWFRMFKFNMLFMFQLHMESYVSCPLSTRSKIFSCYVLFQWWTVPAFRFRDCRIQQLLLCFANKLSYPITTIYFPIYKYKIISFVSFCVAKLDQVHIFQTKSLSPVGIWHYTVFLVKPTQISFIKMYSAL